MALLASVCCWFFLLLLVVPVFISYAQMDNSASAHNIVITLYLEVFQATIFSSLRKAYGKSVDQYDFQ